jgi:hypothetical protein
MRSFMMCMCSLVIDSGVGHFFPGSLMTENQHGTPLTIAYLALTHHVQVAEFPRD